MYLVTFILIAVFIAWEVYQFVNTQQLIKRYQYIFPDSVKDNLTLNENIQIETGYNSEAFDNIVSTLNRYLDENSEQVSDYHLMKDVVDRNREISESEIETLIPFTQYIGLVGTMIGIFIGVSILVFGGGVESLMSEMTNNLSDFNDTFSTNTQKLDKTLSKVNDSYLGQAKLLEELERIDITNIAAANVKVYQNLKNCTEEIGMLTASLKDARLYVETVRELTSKLGEADERVKTWERMGQFFEKEINEIEKRKAFISEAVGNVDEKLESSFSQLGRLSKEKVDKMAEKIVDQNEKLDQAMSMQHNILENKLSS